MALTRPSLILIYCLLRAANALLSVNYTFSSVYDINFVHSINSSLIIWQTGFSVPDNIPIYQTSKETTSGSFSPNTIPEIMANQFNFWDVDGRYDAATAQNLYLMSGQSALINSLFASGGGTDSNSFIGTAGFPGEYTLAVFGENPNVVYTAYYVNSNGHGMYVNRYERAGTASNMISTYQIFYALHRPDKIFFTGNKLYIISEELTSQQTWALLMDTASLQWNAQQIMLQPRTYFFCDINELYIYIIINTGIYLIDLANFNSVVAWDYLADITLLVDLKLVKNTVVFLTTTELIQQMLPVPLAMAQLALGQTVLRRSEFEHEMKYLKQTQKLYVFASQTELFVIRANNAYYCPVSQGCVCEPGYQHGVLGQNCVEAVTPPISPLPIPIVNPVLILPPQAAAPTSPSDTEESYCLNFQQGHCSVVCSYDCLTCAERPGLCLECRPMHTLTEDMRCEADKTFAILSIFGAILNQLRPSGLRNAMFFFFNFQLYNYHKTEYTGLFREVLDYANTFKNTLWSFFPIPAVKQWLGEPYDLESYNLYTNEKFLKVERSDSLFMQNTKDYFNFFIPYSLLVFLVLNRISKYVKNRKVRNFLKVYSIWFYACVIIVLQNLQSLTLYALQNLTSLHSMSYKVRIATLVSVSLIGLLFILTISLFPLATYFCSPKPEQFLTNMKKRRVSFALMFGKCAAKLLMDTAVHTLLYAQPVTQKLALIGSSAVFTAIMVYIEIRQRIFEIKGVFWSEVCLQVSYILLNLILLVRHDFDVPAALKALAEQMLTNLLHLMMFLVLAGCFYCYLVEILALLHFTAKTKMTRVTQPPAKKKAKQENILNLS